MGQGLSYISSGMFQSQDRSEVVDAQSPSSQVDAGHHAENYETNYQVFENVATDVSPSLVSSLNGLVFEDRVVPEEVLTLILSCVGALSLPNCRQVCLTWRRVVDSQIWRYILNKDVYKRLMSHAEAKELPFYALYVLYLHDPFNRNLIQNPSGKEKFKYWKIVMNRGGKWAVEDPPNGAEKLLPESEGCDETSCFVTSYYECYKEQEINLLEIGAVPQILDVLKPKIHVSEWYAARFDCGSLYDLNVELLDRHRKVLDSFRIQKTVEQWAGNTWHKVSHEFDYQRGIRYIRFLHGGKDTQFWAGHYGSKMRNACVKIVV